MARSRIAITLDVYLLGRLDRLGQAVVFPNRSRAIQAALEDKLARLEHNRLARECARLDPEREKTLAEEGLSEDASEWPEY